MRHGVPHNHTKQEAAKKQTPLASSPSTSAPPLSSLSNLRGASPETILSLQRTHGNQAVQRMLAQQPSLSPSGSGVQVQRKLPTAVEFENQLRAPIIPRKHAYRRAASSMKQIVEILEDNTTSVANKLPLLLNAIQYVENNKATKATKYQGPLNRLRQRIAETQEELIEASADPDEKRAEIFEQSKALRKEFKNREDNEELVQYRHLEPKDQEAIASIVADYGTLQKMLRGQQDPSVKEMTRADKVVKAFAKMQPVGGEELRESDHFPNGSSKASSLVKDEVYKDDGLFFVGEGLVKGTHKMLIKFHHAYRIPASVAKAIFGHDEPQCVMLPGSTFRYDGKENEKYVFTQLS